METKLIKNKLSKSKPISHISHPSTIKSPKKSVEVAME